MGVYSGECPYNRVKGDIPAEAGGLFCQQESIMYNLLEDPVVTIRTNNGLETLALPGVYTALVGDRTEDFPRLRPHQSHPWYAALCQLGTIAMVNAGISDPPRDEGAWRGMLRALTADFLNDEPWHLTWPDITQPAFMQPAASSDDKRGNYNSTFETPDTLDVLVSSKRHDIKGGVMRSPRPEHWLYALVTQQTGDNSAGAGSTMHGVSRIANQAGNRHGFSLAPSMRPGRRFVRDVSILVEEHWNTNVSGSLLWLLPWNGSAAESIPFDAMNAPTLYVEICRRIRLDMHDGRILATRASTRGPRIDAKALNGLTGDPWCIEEREQARAVTITRRGGEFQYGRIARYLDTTEHRLPILAQYHANYDTPEAHLVAYALTKSQGKTEGLYGRDINMSRGRRGSMASRLDNGPFQADLHRLVKRRVEIISDVMDILGHAIKAFMEDGIVAGTSASSTTSARQRSRKRLSSIIDDCFWDHVQYELDADDSNAVVAEWATKWLVPEARKQLLDVMQAKNQHHTKRFKAEQAAEGIFDNRCRDIKSIPQSS